MLKKQQVGLRLPRYLVQEIDTLACEFDLNRSEIIMEAIRSYLDEQKTAAFYAEFDQATQEMKASLEHTDSEKTLGGLIDELEDNQPAQL